MRIDEIEDAAVREYSSTICLQAFTDGAKWADKHPEGSCIELWVAKNKFGELLVFHEEPKLSNDGEWCGGMRDAWLEAIVRPNFTIEESPCKLVLTLKLAK